MALVILGLMASGIGLYLLYYVKVIVVRKNAMYDSHEFTMLIENFIKTLPRMTEAGLKVYKEHHDEIFEFVKRYIKNNPVFTIGVDDDHPKFLRLARISLEKSHSCELNLVM